MEFRHIRDRLLPGPEDDARFKEYLSRTARSGLRTMGVVLVAAPALMQVAWVLMGPVSERLSTRWLQTAALVLTGLVTLAVSAHPFSDARPRLLAGLAAWASSALLIGASLIHPPGPLGTDHYILSAITLAIMTGVATTPFRPWHALALGLSIEATYLVAYRFAQAGDPAATVHAASHFAFLMMLTLLATGIAAANYGARRAEFDAHQEAVRVAEALAGAQLRAQLAENAISIGKMAAALSHEINSPVGALRSSVSTLLSIMDRKPGGGEESERLLRARAQLRRSIDESTARIDDVVLRLRRFVNLEEAELKQANINELLTDVALLHQEEIEKSGVQIDFELEKPLPELTCRPQLLSAVFSSLLSNAIQAVNGEGRVRIATRRDGQDVEVTVRDNGRGMSPEQAENIFDPSFKVAGNRVSSGNWSLFNTRQIVYEHGGEITVETAEGKGTAVHVTLPAIGR